MTRALFFRIALWAFRPRVAGEFRRDDAMNALGVIAPYKYEGMWVFDDPAVGLVREPFVAGIDTMIDRLVRSLPIADAGCRVIVSACSFRGHTVKLEWCREDSGGNWYYSS